MFNFKVIFLVLSFLLFSRSSQAEPLEVGGFIGTPWGYEHGGQVVGIAAKIANVTAKEAGLEINLHLVPFKRMLVMLRDGIIDCAFFYRSVSSEVIAEPIARIHRFKNVIYGSSDLNLKTYEDLEKFEIAVPLGARFSLKFDQDKGLHKTFVQDYAIAVRMFKMNRVTAVAGSQISLDYLFRRYDVPPQDLSAPLSIGHKEMWLQFSRLSNKLDLIPILQKTVKKLSLEGVYERLIEQGEFVLP